MESESNQTETAETCPNCRALARSAAKHRAQVAAELAGTWFVRSLDHAPAWITYHSLARSVADCLVARLRSDGIEASDAPDHIERGRRWVYATLI